MEKGEKKYKEIELRSEEVQEVMSQVPPWILRRGITTLFVIVIALLAGSWFFKYPDTITAEITVTSLEPLASIIARSTGKIDRIWAKNNQMVTSGTPLAVIQNPASANDMLRLREMIHIWNTSEYGEVDAAMFLSGASLGLGMTQPVFASFLSSLNDYQNYKTLNYYPQKITAQKQQLAAQKEYYDRIVKQASVVSEQFITSQSIFRRDSVLLAKNVISDNEYELSKSGFLQNKQAYLSFDASLKQSELQLMQGEENLLDLQQQAIELERKYTLTLQNAAEALNAQIKSWERDYLLVSPIDGSVSQMGVWSSNQNVNAGETVFTVMPHLPF